MSKQRLVLIYICLVGAPLLGLLGILHAGQRLSAPVSVGGAWLFESNFDALPNDACRQLLGSVKEPFLSISQSGVNLVFNINNPQKTTLPGEIQGSALTMSADPSATPADENRPCRDPQAIHLDATVGQQGGRSVLTGTLGISGCRDCAPIPFRAVRQSGQGGL